MSSEPSAWIPVTARLPEPTGTHGYSEYVIVNVVCDNGHIFRECDRYDSHTQTWDKYHPPYGTLVTHWQPMPAAPAAQAPTTVEEFADEVKALCDDFSSRNGNVYILDVKARIDALVALYSPAQKDTQ